MLRGILLCGLLVHSVAVHVQLGRHAGGKEFRQKMFSIQDVQYYSIVKLAGQELHAVMDTGSPDLIVLSDKCRYMCGDTARLFHAASSTSYQTGVDSQILSYGSGDLVGREAYDSFSVGPLKSGVQAFWEIVDAKMPLLSHSDFQVIVGLGPISPDVHAMTPDGDNQLAGPGMLDSLNITTYSACILPRPQAGGFLVWNDESVKRSPHMFVELQVLHSAYWMVQLSDVRLGAKNIGCQTGCGAIIDTGTSLLSLPKKHYTRLQRLVWRLGPNCNDISGLPHLHFKLGDYDFSLPPDAYLGEVEGLVSDKMQRHFKTRDSRGKVSCQEAIMHVSLDSDFGPTWVFGMPFFRSYYTVFRQDPPKMFAAKAGTDCEPTSSKSTSLMPVQLQRTARRINATKLTLSPFLQHQGMSLGLRARRLQM